MKTMNFFVIRAISNLHVGSGEGDFSIVDKQVQRDQVTGLPTIHASGIKGALREAMTYEGNGGNKAKPISADLIQVFGSDPKNRESIQQGKYNFYDAQLLALPVRSSRDFFYVATCPELLETCISLLEAHQPDNIYLDSLKAFAKEAGETSLYFGKNQSGEIQLEDWKASHNSHDIASLLALFGPRIALLTNEQFKHLAKELPIIARNYLNDGISENLWYEEVVPREARFGTMISKESDNDQLHDFLKKKKYFLQLGANATVGYGLCEFKPLEDVTEN